MTEVLPRFSKCHGTKNFKGIALESGQNWIPTAQTTAEATDDKSICKATLKSWQNLYVLCGFFTTNRIQG